MKPTLKVAWISAGVSSAMAAYIVKNTIDLFIYIDLPNDQHPDSMRFIKDLEARIGKPILVLTSPVFESVEQVCDHQGIMRHINGYAPCTDWLKAKVRTAWELQHTDYDITYVWGFDPNEELRAYGGWVTKNGKKVYRKGVADVMPNFKHEFPLIEKSITKQDAHAMCQRLGIKRPAMYDQGYNNNNCIGCVKGGMGYWNQIRKDYPDVFNRRAKQERRLNSRCLKECYLDELPENAGNAPKEIMQDCSFFCNAMLGQIDDDCDN